MTNYCILFRIWDLEIIWDLEFEIWDLINFILEKNVLHLGHNIARSPLMTDKTIGILGGMGPEATLDCFGKIIKNTPAKTDQEHLRVVMDSNPAVSDAV